MNSQFVEKEFAGMMFNPMKVPDGKNIFKVFPDLEKVPVFKKSAGPGLDNQKVMLWVLCMYDKNTPYRAKYKDALKRKIEVAHDVGFEIENTGIFTAPVEDFLKGFNEKVNRKVIEFIRMHKSFKYSYFVGIENSYYGIMQEVMKGQTKRMKEFRELGDELEEVLMQLLNEDDNPHTKEAFLRYVEEDRLHLRPEDIALKILKNEQPITHKEIL